MQSRAWVSRREAGASAVEYAAAFALVAILIVAVAWAARLTPMGTVMTEAVCKVSAAVGIGVCADGPDEGGGEQTLMEELFVGVGYRF